MKPTFILALSLVLFPIIAIANETPSLVQLVIKTDAVPEINLRISCDDSVLVPELAGLKLTSNNFFPASSHSGIDSADTTFKNLLDSHPYNLSDSIPYFIMATDAAIRRVLNNLLYSNHHLDRIKHSMEVIGYDSKDIDFSRTARAQNVLGLTGLPKKLSLSVHIYFDRDSFLHAAKNKAGLRRAEAFYKENAIGVYVDKRLFKWIGFQAQWDDRGLQETIQLLQDYVDRIMDAGSE